MFKATVKVNRPRFNRDLFVESKRREDGKNYLSLLHERLSVGNNLIAITHSNTDPAKSHTISGLGGIGKTQLAIAYANIYEPEYDFIGWINAENQAQLINSYRDILKEKIFAKGICEDEEISIDGKSKEEIKDEIEKIISSKNQQEIVKLLIDVLPKSRKRWLLIYDNAENAAELNLNNNKLVPEKGGHIIVTSRSSDWSQVLPLDVFQIDEAVDYLFKATQKERTSSEEEFAKQIAKELGCLPLALSQAAAYIREGKGKISFQEYLSDFQKRKPRLLTHKLSSDESYENVVMTTWNITMEKLAERFPLARSIIDRCAFLASDDIPLSFFSDLPEEAVLDAARALNNYSMIKFNESRDEISLHRLVQAVTRIELKKNSAAVINALAESLLKVAFDSDGSDTEILSRHPMLLPHLLSVICYADNYKTNLNIQIAQLCNNFSSFITNIWSKDSIAAVDLLNIALDYTKSTNNELDLELLIPNNTNVNNARRKDGVTSLIYASAWGYTDVVKLLIEKGAQVNKEISKDNPWLEGYNALFFASARGHKDVVKLLIEAGADVNQANNDNEISTSKDFGAV